MIQSSPLLEVKNLVTELGAGKHPVKAVDNINFTINKGEVVGVAGESGAGKTTLALSILKLINHPDKITKGNVLYYKEDVPIDLLSLHEKELCRYRGKKIAMIFQDPKSALNPVYTCGKQVSETIVLHERCLHRMAKEKTIQLFKEVNLPDAERIFSAYPHQLSGGQLQQVMIAMAVCCNPSLLIADEPTSSLDSENENHILSILRKLNKEKGLSLLLITHSPAILSTFADRVLVIKKGKVVEASNETSALDPSFGKTSQKKNEITHPVGTPILQVRNLKKYFSVQEGFFSFDKKIVKAVDDVSFDIYKGETVGLIGKSGCGKTTLARCILRLIDPTSGNISFKGNEISSFSQKEMLPLRKSIQIIFQNSFASLNPKINIGEAIIEPMRIHKLFTDERERKAKAIGLLEKVKLDSSCMNRYPHEFSGGERQRICIARALSLNPELIICDEPVSSLDASTQLQVLDLLLQLQKELNIAYLFISHNREVIHYMSNRVLKMQGGKISAATAYIIENK